MTKSSFENSDYLGDFNPYYFYDNQGNLEFVNSFEEAVKLNQGTFTLDKSSIVSVLSMNHMLGDRSIISGIFRSPWLARPNEGLKSWDFGDWPTDNKVKLTAREIAFRLHELLIEEISNAVGVKKKIGILLSGGMDSRIVAGVLDEIISKHSSDQFKVTAYTWGLENSRDVVYAKRIADHYDWKWKHFTVEYEDLVENAKIAAIRGCEYSGLHLHAMPKIAAYSKDEIILAGSYGDSVGRAEYSGRHITRLTPIIEGVRNTGWLLNKESFEEGYSQLQSEVVKYRQRFRNKSEVQLNEMERQAHYMRRMLNPCMEVIHHKVPLFQAFTSPKVFHFMWSLDPSLRDDHIYNELFNELDPFLKILPWARTGLPYGEKSGIPDSYEKQNHTYWKYLNDNAFINLIKNELLGVDLPFINIKAIENLIKLISVFPNHNARFTEPLLWLLSYKYFLKEYDLGSLVIKSSKAGESVTIKQSYSYLEYKSKLILNNIRKQL